MELVLEGLSRRLVALGGFSAIMLPSHVPGVVDGLIASQVGALLIDVARLVGGFLLWWPVTGPSPEVVRLSRRMNMGYLFLSTLAPISPSVFLALAEYLLYSTYELAPRIFPVMIAPAGGGTSDEAGS
jgi:putative membrane protein